MAKTSTKILLQSALMALVIVSLVHQAMGFPICNIDSNDLQLCRAAVTGTPPPKPTKGCCSVVRRVDLVCLCGYKSALPAVGIDPANALALPAKCGLKNTPPQCRS